MWSEPAITCVKSTVIRIPTPHYDARYKAASQSRMVASDRQAATPSSLSVGLAFASAARLVSKSMAA